jgi:hypothetical protein
VASRRKRTRLPIELRSFFWEFDFAKLSIEEDRSTIVYRLVEHGPPAAIKWLRATFGDVAIHDELAAIEARGFRHDKVRRWVSASEYAKWARSRPPSLWEGR